MQYCWGISKTPNELIDSVVNIPITEFKYIGAYLQFK